jgi:hypothetical protein
MSKIDTLVEDFLAQEKIAVVGVSDKREIGRMVKETGTIPFDAPGVEIGHHEGRCSFEWIIMKSP